jgi:hypothetical protein
MFVLQAIKFEFREKTWEGNYTGDRLELFTSLFFSKIENMVTGNKDKPGVDFLNSKNDEIGEVNNRLNQGWIISKIMSYIPSQSPYLEGETVKEAIFSSLQPRLLNEDKKGGGGKYTFEKLTGMKLLSGTAMGVSIIGEAYGNFGSNGAFMFMFLWGCMLGLFLQVVVKKSNDFYTLPLWLPIIFLQVIKAESDLITVFNHLVKSTVFVFAVLFFLKKVWRVSV